MWFFLLPCQLCNPNGNHVGGRICPSKNRIISNASLSNRKKHINTEYYLRNLFFFLSILLHTKNQCIFHFGTFANTKCHVLMMWYLFRIDFSLPFSFYLYYKLIVWHNVLRVNIVPVWICVYRIGYCRCEFT